MKYLDRLVVTVVLGLGIVTVVLGVAGLVNGTSSSDMGSHKYSYLHFLKSLQLH